ncbi:MAG: VCBS repeat-containing protein [Pyrinomonadaceae bacterium]
MKLQKSIIAIIAFFTLALSIEAQTNPQIQFRKKFDFNGDNKADIAVMRNDFDTNRKSYQILNSANPPSYFVIDWGVLNDWTIPGDFDGDGKGDYVSARAEGVNTSWYISVAGGTSYRRVVFGYPLSADENPVVADYDGDGKDDIAVARRSTTAPNTFTYYWLRSSDGQLGGRVVASNPAYTTCRSSVPGDYNGDFKADFVVRCRASDNQMFFDITDNASNTTQTVRWGIFTAYASNLLNGYNEGDIFAPGDYDGDRKTDVAVVRFVQTGMSGDLPVGSLYWYIRRTGDGSTYVRVYGGVMLNGNFGYRVDFPVPADYDGDGITDLAVSYGIGYDAFYFITENSTNGAVRYTRFGANDIESAYNFPIVQMQTSRFYSLY